MPVIPSLYMIARRMRVSFAKSITDVAMTKRCFIMQLQRFVYSL